MKKYKNFMSQIKDLSKMQTKCKQYTEWSTSEFEADMWIDAQKKINNLIKYYETDK